MLVQIYHQERSCWLICIPWLRRKIAGRFKLPMSYTALAQYLSVDRSAMMREIKNLSDEGVIKRDGRNVELR